MCVVVTCVQINQMLRTMGRSAMQSSLGKRSLAEREFIEAHYLRGTGRGSQSRDASSASSSRPTHFLALPVNDFKPLKPFVSKVHSQIVKHAPGLKEALVEPESAHITLGVLTLKDENEFQRLSTTLKQWFNEREGEETEGPLEIELKNVKQFKSGVLYIEAHSANNRLCQFHEALASFLKTEGFLDKVDKSFNPHVTLAKFSKMKRRNKNGKQNGVKTPKMFPAKSYEEDIRTKVGTCEVRTLQVCCIVGRVKGEYYKVAKSFQL